jgi:hypothetical protein
MTTSAVPLRVVAVGAGLGGLTVSVLCANRVIGLRYVLVDTDGLSV